MSAPPVSNSPDLAKRTIEDFGEQWTRFTTNDGFYASLDLLRDICEPLVPVSAFVDRRVVEIGSGTGRIVQMALAAGAAHVTATEPSVAFDVLTRNLADAGGRVDCVRTTGDQLPLGLNADLVVAIGVLHHIPDPAPVVEAAFRALRPGGRILVWLYGREGNAAYLALVAPLRALTTRLPAAPTLVLARGTQRDVHRVYGRQPCRSAPAPRIYPARHREIHACKAGGGYLRSAETRLREVLHARGSESPDRIGRLHGCPTPSSAWVQLDSHRYSPTRRRASFTMMAGGSQIQDPFATNAPVRLAPRALLAEWLLVLLAPLAAWWLFGIVLINQDSFIDPWIYVGYGRAFTVFQTMFGWPYYAVRFPVVMLNALFLTGDHPLIGYAALRYLLLLSCAIPLYLWSRKTFGRSAAALGYLFLICNPLFPRIILWDLTTFVSVPMALAGMALWLWSDRASSRFLSGVLMMASIASHAFTGSAIATFLAVQAVRRLRSRELGGLLRNDVLATALGAATTFGVGCLYLLCTTWSV